MCVRSVDWLRAHVHFGQVEFCWSVGFGGEEGSYGEEALGEAGDDVEVVDVVLELGVQLFLEQAQEALGLAERVEVGGEAREQLGGERNDQDCLWAVWLLAFIASLRKLWKCF